MRVLFLTENFPPETNAAATRVYERARYWAAWGHEVTVITSQPNFPQGRLFPGYRNRWYQATEMDGIRVVRVKTFIARNEGVALRTLDFLSFMLTAAAAGLFQRRPDVVVATSPQFFAAVGGWLLAAARRLPFVFELGDLWPASIKAVGAVRASLALRAIERLELFLYRRAAAVVALTSSFKEDLVRRGIPERKIAVVINGVDLPRYAPIAKDAELLARLKLQECFVVGYIGTHGMAHALERVLEAANALRDVPRVSFLFVGAGAARDALVRQAEQEQLNNVVFVPIQPKEMMPRFWSLCDVALIHLKNDETFAGVIPSKLFEAMGMGLPVLLAAPAGEASRIVDRERMGIHVPAEQPQALANAVRQLASDDALLRGFAGASHRAAPLYSRERQAEDMMKVLESVRDGNGYDAAGALHGRS